MATKRKMFTEGIKLKQTTNATTEQGELRVDSADSKLKANLDSSERAVVTEDQTQTLTNKSVDADNNTISNLETDNLKSGVLNTSTTLDTASDTQIPSALAVKTYVNDSVAGKDEASEITYDNSTSGLTATDVQAAVDEVEDRVDTAETNIGNNATAISDHLSDTVDAHDASAISNVPTGNLAATTVQGAVDELQGDIDTINTNVGNNATAISDHLSDAVDAHDASAISSVASGNLAATDVQSALNELQGDIDDRALASDLSDHINDVADAHAASAITNTPSGNLAATDLQSAVNELQSDIDDRALDSDLTTHISDTSTHGVSGDLVGTSDTQTLTNKTIQGASIETPSRLDVKQDTLANLTTYASSAANGQICFATDTKQMFQVIDAALAPIGGGVSDVDILEVIESFDTSDGLTTLTSGIHGQTFRLTHDASVLKYAEKDIALDDKFRNKQLQLLVDLKTTAASGNFKVVITDVTNSKTLADEILTPQDTGALTSKRSVTFSTTPADGDLAIATINVQFEALVESGSPTSDFDDIVVQLAKTEVREIIAIEQEENEFSARIANNGTATITSQNYPFIESVTRTGTGVISVVYKSGFFTTTPSVKVTNDLASGSRIYSYIDTGSSSGFIVYSQDDNGISFDKGVSIHVSRQGSDYRDLTRRVEREISTFKEVIVEESSSYLQINGFTGALASAATQIFTLSSTTVVQNIGSAIEYVKDATNGDKFIAQKDGDYSFSGSFALGSANTSFGLSKNSTALTSAWSTIPISERLVDGCTPGAGVILTISWRGYLSAGDVVRLHNYNAGTIASDGGSNCLSVSYTGVPKIAQVAPDSKIEIPTSEVRFEGSTGKGTGDEAYTVAFQTLAKIRGDALSVSNSNGTIITVLKDGIININTFNTTGGTVRYGISKNASTPSTYPSSSELLISEDNRGASATDVTSCNIAGYAAKAGDIFRVWSDGSISSSTNAVLEISHQEQRIAVAISNITPQYEDVDSMVRVRTGNGHGSTNNRIRRFSSVIKNLGTAIIYIDSATEGAKFVINESGLYNISYTDSGNSGAARCGISLNATQFTTDVNNINADDILSNSNSYTATASIETSWSGYLEAGDIIRPHTDGNTTATTTGGVSFTIAKVGVPSIAEVDVTPFADVNRIKSGDFSANYQQGIASAASPYFRTVTRNTLAGLGTITNNSTSGWSFTALSNCRINLHSSFATDAGGNDYYTLSLNSSLVGPTLVSSDKTLAYGYSGGIGQVGLSWSGDLVAGDVIRIHADATPNPANSASVSLHVEADSRTTMYSVAQTENEFSARIQNNGVATLLSESENFIDSVSRTAIGRVTVTFKSGFFTELPNVVATSSGSNERHGVIVNNLTTSSVQIGYVNNADTFADSDFHLQVSRQGADRQDLQKAIVQLNEFPRVNKVISQHISHNSAGSTLTERNTEVEFNLSNVVNSGSSIISIVDDSANTRTKFIALKDCRVNLSFNARVANAGGYQTVVYVNGNLVQRGSNSSGAGSSAYVSYSGKLNKDDYITVGIFIDTVENSAELCQLNILAEAEDLEVITNVDAHENAFSARIANNGTATITSQNYPFIESVTRSGAGTVDIVFKSGFFTTTPSIIVNDVGVAPSGNASDTLNPTSSGVTIYTALFNGAASDIDFAIHVSRQGSDYKSIQDVVAQVFTPKTAYLKDVKPSGTGGGTFNSGSYVERDINTVEGDSEIVSLSGNKFTLQAGKYLIEASVPAYRVEGNKAKLVSDPSGSPTDVAIGTATNSTATSNVTTLSLISGFVEITTTTTYNIQHRCQNTVASNGFGYSPVFGDDEVYTQVKITKIY